MEQRTGFSLVEILAAMVIGTMILIAVFKVYGKATRTAAVVTRNLDSFRRPYEVLQLIAEDLDKMITTNSDTSIIIVNRYIENYAAAILVVTEKYKDSTNKDQNYKEIYWQCNIDPEGDADDLVLYRLYDGVTPEDKLLDKDKDEFERKSYAPICEGVTYFDIEIYSDKKRPEDIWAGGMPFGVTITISFAEPFKNDEGNYDVPESEKYSRTIAFDKSRKIKFDVSEEELPDGQEIKTNVDIVENEASSKKSNLAENEKR